MKITSDTPPHRVEKELKRRRAKLLHHVQTCWFCSGMCCPEGNRKLVGAGAGCHDRLAVLESEVALIMMSKPPLMAEAKRITTQSLLEHYETKARKSVKQRT